MKKMKKVLSILLASVMTLAMAAPGFAENKGTGSITITNTTAGKVYNVYKLFDANPSGNGNNKDGENKALIAYTAEENQVKTMVEAAGETYISGQETYTDGYFVFTATKTQSSDSDGETVKYNVTKNPDKPDNEVIDHLSSTFFEKEDKVDKDTTTEPDKQITKLKEKYKDLFTKVEGEGKTVEGNPTALKFDGLEYGYYFVTSSLGTALTITSTNYDVTIFDKNQGPHWDDKEKGDGGKKITKINDNVLTIENPNDPDGEPIPAPTDVVSANYEDKITYEVKFQATDYDGEKKVKEYYLKDVLAPGMSYVKNGNNVALEIKVEGKEKNGYTLQSTDYTITTTTTDEKNEFELRIPWINENGTFKYPYTDSVQTVTITYSAIVDTDAVIAEDGNKNKVSLAYWTEDQTPDNPDEPNKPHEVSGEKTTTTYVYALAINKTDKAGKGLSGAVFALTDNTNNANPIYVTDGGNDGQGNQIYLYEKAAENPDPEHPQSNKVTSPTNGVIIIKGIKEGEYKLTEIEAPNGYNLLKDAVVVSSVKTGEAIKKSEKTTIYYDADGNIIDEITTSKKEIILPNNVEIYKNAIKNVVNVAGTILPATGGIGTTIFYAAGIILMAGAVFFVVRRKRA